MTRSRGGGSILAETDLQQSRCYAAIFAKRLPCPGILAELLCSRAVPLHVNQVNGPSSDKWSTLERLVRKAGWQCSCLKDKRGYLPQMCNVRCSEGEKVFHPES